LFRLKLRIERELTKIQVFLPVSISVLHSIFTVAEHLNQTLFIMSNISLPCQLLCASASAYAISTTDPSGQYNPLVPGSPFQNQYDAVGFIGDPYVVTADQIEAALVGQTANGIIVAFRGTLPPALNWDSFFDWLQDFMAPTTRNGNLPGEVHEGFLFALTKLKDGIIRAIRALDPGGSLPIYITGHSKGGGIAPIAAMYFRNANGLNITQTITFAGPNCGNGDFVNAYNETFPNDVRYENYLDIVPLLPPDSEFITLLKAIPDLPASFVRRLNEMEAYDYQPVGNLTYIDSSAVATAYPAWEADLLLPVRMAEIIEKIMTLDFSAIADAHHASCGYRYMQGTCTGTTICPV
jgi:hypothetical protein